MFCRKKRFVCYVFSSGLTGEFSTSNFPLTILHDLQFALFYLTSICCALTFRWLNLCVTSTTDTWSLSLVLTKYKSSVESFLLPQGKFRLLPV